jgi:HD superfamily phosphodiesterase
MRASMVERARAQAEDRLAELPRRLGHLRGVADAAHRLVAQLGPAESESVMAATWLHDIGYSSSVTVAGFHPVDGAESARTQGFPER